MNNLTREQQIKLARSLLKRLLRPMNVLPMTPLDESLESLLDSVAHFLIVRLPIDVVETAYREVAHAHAERG